MTRLPHAVVLAIALLLSVQAAGAQVAPVRVEFTRPGGVPGSARAVVKPSEAYMIAPAQPESVTAPKRRKAR